VQDKKSDRHPDYTGNIEITGEQIKKLIEMNKAGFEVKLSLSAWNTKAKTGEGDPYISLDAQAYMPQPKPDASAFGDFDDDIPF
jgi:hypothetical protein